MKDNKEVLTRVAPPTTASTDRATADGESGAVIAAQRTDDVPFDDLDACRQILAADMTQPDTVQLPPMRIRVPAGSVAFALYALVQETRSLREYADNALGLRAALKWLAHLHSGVGKAGAEPEAGEWEAAIDAAKAAIATAEGHPPQRGEGQ